MRNLQVLFGTLCLNLSLAFGYLSGHLIKVGTFETAGVTIVTTLFALSVSVSIMRDVR